MPAFRMMIASMLPVRVKGQSTHARTMLTSVLPAPAHAWPEHPCTHGEKVPGTAVHANGQSIHARTMITSVLTNHALAPAPAPAPPAGGGGGVVEVVGVVIVVVVIMLVLVFTAFRKPGNLGRLPLSWSKVSSERPQALKLQPRQDGPP